MDALLDADLWYGMLVEDDLDWQATMFQPVGGMDRIPTAFAQRLDPVIRYGAAVTGMRQSATGVTVTYRTTSGAEDTSGRLLHLRHAAHHRAHARCRLQPADSRHSRQGPVRLRLQIAWEAPRFWEKEANIYGGISYLQQTVDLVWYPSARIFTEKGILIGGYSIEPTGRQFFRRPARIALHDGHNGYVFGHLPSMQAKLDASRHSVELLHPGHGKDLAKPIYISWGQIPYNLGSWISFNMDDEETLATLQAPDRRVYFAGDHTSRLVGWQEGAALSAHRVINQLGARIESGG